MGRHPQPSMNCRTMRLEVISGNSRSGARACDIKGREVGSMSSDYYLVSQQPIQRASRMRTLPEASSRHESGCTSVDPVVYYAYRIVLEASKLKPADALMLRALGMAWGNPTWQGNCQTANCPAQWMARFWLWPTAISAATGERLDSWLLTP